MNYRKILDEILTKVLTINPYVDINVDTNMNFLSSDLALLLSDVYFQLDILKIKYNISDKDLMDMEVILDNGTKIPSRLLEKIRGSLFDKKCN